MSTMNTVSYSDALLPLAGTDTRETTKTAPGFFARVLEALIESRRRAVAREIARHHAMYGFEPDSKVEGELPFGR